VEAARMLLGHLDLLTLEESGRFLHLERGELLRW
jgi:hypothetical protein